MANVVARARHDSLAGAGLIEGSLMIPPLLGTYMFLSGWEGDVEGGGGSQRLQHLTAAATSTAPLELG